MDKTPNFTQVFSKSCSKDKNLEVILLLKYKKYVETFVYHIINIQDMYNEANQELKTSLGVKDDIKEEIEYDPQGKLLDTFVQLQNNLKKYTLEMKKVFSCHYFMSEVNLQKLESRACQRSVSSEADDSLLSWTINQYGRKYSEINKEVFLSEQDILEKTVTPIVLQWYQNEFLCEEISITPTEKHKILKTTCKEGIKNCLSYSDNHVDLLKSAFEKLDLKLDQLFEKMKGKGEMSLRMSSDNRNFENSSLNRCHATDSSVPENVPTLLNMVTPTLAVEFDPSGIKCGVMGDGKLLIMANENNQSHFQFSVEFDKKDQVLLNGTLQESFSTDWNFQLPMKQKAGNQNIQIKTPNGGIVDVGEELVCALALEKVKRLAGVILGREIQQVTIAIPLRYTSTKRRSIKDAAEIAGFKKVNLITETTAAAIAYFKNSRKTAEDLRKTLFVLIHGKSHYDAAVYRMEDGVVQMVTCTGNCHNHKRKDERLEKHIVRKFKKTQASVMIYGGNDQAVAVSISQQLSCKLEPVKSAVLLGTAKYSELDSKNKVFLDLFPYKLKLKDPVTKNTILTLSRRSKCYETKDLRGQLQTVNKASKPIIAIEKGVSQFPTGEFPIKGDYFLCTLDEEGILTISHDNAFISNNFGLQPEAKELCSYFLTHKVNQEELRILAEFLLKTSVNIPESFVREDVRLEAAAALEFLRNGASSLEILQHKIYFLKELKSKYAN